MDVQPPPYEPSENTAMHENTGEGQESAEARHFKEAQEPCASLGDPSGSMEHGQGNVRQVESSSGTGQDQAGDDAHLARALSVVTLSANNRSDSAPEDDSVSVTDSDDSAGSSESDRSTQGQAQGCRLPLGKNSVFSRDNELTSNLEDGFDPVEDLMVRTLIFSLKK